ncbi:MAG: 50S ribosomal protein L3 [candidate division WS6 bacterium GW2011_GWF2_39_15]|uniref:50S ribosomal protein L3 n=1 Tax=candidate division WS6 bacterium GW2011_GWF2_39_15 TaxID=1619100 RepID=A0A0G0MYP1_9BACT|nr:MAG: 50S ribosomal protein L3 [candidate division WS6 bacterium GW2011_GWF2_39_15]
MKAIIGIKKGMTRVFKGEKSVPVTVVDVTGCVVSHKDDKGLELGVGKKRKNNKALEGKYKALGYVPMLREYVFGLTGEMQVGQEVKADTFAEGEKVSIMGITKGKGFAGVVKRYGFAGGPKTHGQSDRHRAPGSIGAGTTPGRVLKGKRMAGHLGTKTVTLNGREVVSIVDSFLLLSGPIPGNRGDKVVIYTKE